MTEPARSRLAGEDGAPSGERAVRVLIPAERQARLLEIIRRQGAASIQNLAAELGASLSTTRRDLDELTARGYLERTHGGAVLRSRFRTTFEPSRDIAGNMALAQKQAIGRYAADLLGPGQSVIFDSGSTVLEGARAAAARDIPLTAVTNDLVIGQELGRSDAIKVIVTGGTLRPGSVTLVGDTCLELIRRFRADVALIGIHSLAGLRASETSLDVAAVKRALSAAGHRVILLADSSKFESPAFCEVGPLDLFHELVSDNGLAADIRTAVEDRGLRVTTVEPARAS